jgi:hypothetical protein
VRTGGEFKCRMRMHQRDSSIELAGRRARACRFVVVRRKTVSRIMIRKQRLKRQTEIEYEDPDNVSKKHKI